MKLFNTLTKKIQPFEPIKDGLVTIYSCGPTVYDHSHIGNLRAFIAADILRRSLIINGYRVKHVMNITDVDDKMIARSQQIYPDETPEQALEKLAARYQPIFVDDTQSIGNDTNSIKLVKATDNIKVMQKLIADLYKAKTAYIADDGVYFSIKNYKSRGKTYGQLLNLSVANTGVSRIDNDEYDKQSIHDFALWKIRKPNEPAWEFRLDGHSLPGRPGWHIECSAMSSHNLGQPFDIHTGGIDLIFPHHENEIAQSTAAGSDEYARFFVHNEHLMVDGSKMSKSLNNFFTLQDIKEKGFDPLAFRLLVLQAHYKSPLNFTWENLQAAQNRLTHWRSVADLRWQPLDKIDSGTSIASLANTAKTKTKQHLANDIDTPGLMAFVSEMFNQIEKRFVAREEVGQYNDILKLLDQALGLDLLRPDIDSGAKKIMSLRQEARMAKDWDTSDDLRRQLEAQSIYVRDTQTGQVWSKSPR